MPIRCRAGFAAHLTMSLRNRLLARCPDCSLLAEILRQHQQQQQPWWPAQLQQQCQPAEPRTGWAHASSFASSTSSGASPSASRPLAWTWPGRSSRQGATAHGTAAAAAAAGPQLAFTTAQQQQQQQQLQHHPRQVRSSSTTLEKQERECWSCHNRFAKGGVVCTGCNSVQPLDIALNYFQLLGMPSKFNLSLDQLEKRYKQLQWKVHPDRLMGHTPQEQQYSADLATNVNMAYSVLRNPLSRANYLLAQRGIRTDTATEATISDADFLEEVMESREAVEEADDVETLVKLLAENKAQQQDVVTRLGRAFESPSGSREALDLTVRLTYLARLEAQIMGKLPSNPEGSLLPAEGSQQKAARQPAEQ